jgi:23S rRNA A1618 N6-methylase RlmF
MNINNLHISGGKQQFADLIINQSERLSETDRQFIELIDSNVSSEDEKRQLIQSLEVVKNDEADEKDKSYSKGLLKKFLESGVGEAGKEIAKNILTSGIWQMLLN